MPAQVDGALHGSGQSDELQKGDGFLQRRHCTPRSKGSNKDRAKQAQEESVGAQARTWEATSAEAPESRLLASHSGLPRRGALGAAAAPPPQRQ